MKSTVRNRILEYSCMLLIFIGFISSKFLILQELVKKTPDVLEPFMKPFVSNLSLYNTLYPHSSETIYHKLLHVFFLVFGDRADLIIYFHIAIQVVILLALYYSTRKLCGVLAGSISLLGGVFLFIYYGTQVFYEPMIYIIYFLLFVMFVRRVNIKDSRIKRILDIIAIAFVMSTQAWLGVYGLYLLVLYGLILFLYSKKERILKVFIFYSVAAASICSFLVLNPDIEVDFYFQELLHIFSGLSKETIDFLYASHLNYYYIGAVVILACLLTTILLGNRKESIALIILGIGNFVYGLFNGLHPDYLIILGFIGAMIIGNLFQVMWNRSVNKKKAIVLTDPVQKTVEPTAKKEKSHKKEVVEEKVAVEKEEKIIEDRLVAVVKEPEEKINYIENPLPGPKKHVPKQMDFAVDLTDSTRDFDLNILKGKEDFDLK